MPLDFLTGALAHEWIAEAGEFEVLIAASSVDIRGKATFALTATSRFGGSSGQPLLYV